MRNNERPSCTLLEALMYMTRMTHSQFRAYPYPKLGDDSARSAANASLPTAVSSKVKAPVTASPSCASSCRAVPPSAKRLYAATPARRRGSRMWYAPVYLRVRVRVKVRLRARVRVRVGVRVGVRVRVGVGVRVRVRARVSELLGRLARVLAVRGGGR